MRFEVLFVIGGLVVFAEQNQVSNLGQVSSVITTPATVQYIHAWGDVFRLPKNKDPAPGQHSVTQSCVCRGKKSKQMESDCTCKKSKNMKKIKVKQVASRRKSEKNRLSNNIISVPI